MSGGPGLMSSALRVGLGLAAAQALMLGAMPVWARQFAAEDFALLGLWMAASAVVSV